jgi:hypothetical protein
VTYLVQVTLGGCIAWDGSALGANITIAIGPAMVRSLAIFLPRLRALPQPHPSHIRALVIAPAKMIGAMTNNTETREAMVIMRWGDASVMRQRHLPQCAHRAAGDQPHMGDRVMGGDTAAS